MCLAVPGKVIEIFEEAGLKMGNVDYAGTVAKVCLELIPDIKLGQYTVVHAGFAISVIDESEAVKNFDAWEEVVRKADLEDKAMQEDFLSTIGNLKNNTIANR